MVCREAANGVERENFGGKTGAVRVFGKIWRRRAFPKHFLGAMSYFIGSEAERASASPNQHLFPVSAGVDEAGRLAVGGRAVSDLVAEFGSPLYIADEQTIVQGCQQFKDGLARSYPGDSLVLYASKALCTTGVCAMVAAHGCGIDVVSGGELATAVASGAFASHPEHVYLHGSSKDEAEIEAAVAGGHNVVVDNQHDLDVLEAMFSRGVYQHCRVLVRIAPDVVAVTHEKIKTGQRDSKFGFDMAVVDDVFAQLAARRDHVTCVGLHAHIGSMIDDLEKYRRLVQIIVAVTARGRSEFGLALPEINVGGGLAVTYTLEKAASPPPSIGEWTAAIGETMAAVCAEHGWTAEDGTLPRLVIEAGRSLINPAVVTAYTVNSIKRVPAGRTYVSIDGGMSDNPRPTTYDAAYHCVLADRLDVSWPTGVRADGSRAEAAERPFITISGKHCESGDKIIERAILDVVPASGDVLVVPGTGAYNYSMSSNYNRVTRPAMVLVCDDGSTDVLIRRETYADLLKFDAVPKKYNNKKL